MKEALKISFFGSSLVSAYWNGAATYYRGLVRALHDRGHRLAFYEPDAYERQQHRDMPDPEWCRVVVYPAREERDALRAVEEAWDSDLIIKCSGVGVFDDVLERGVLELQNDRRLVAFLDVDAPATLDRIQNNRQDPFLKLIPRYDFILTYGGGNPVVQAYRKVGAKECVPIYNALDPHTHHPVTPQARYEADLNFLGNRMPDREARVEEFFFKAASVSNSQRFILGGSGWGDKPMPSNVQYVGHVYTQDHNAFNCSPLAVLNVNRGSMARYGFSPPTRVFEAAGAGACLITDEWEGIEEFLEPDKEVFVARDGEEVKEIVRNLTPERAKAVGRAAHQRIHAQHTYALRADRLEGLLEGHFQPERI